MESRNHAPNGKLSLHRASLPGLACRWKSHPLLCALHTVQYRHRHRCWKKKSPLPFHHSYLPSLVECDKATDCWWPLHLSPTLCEWESVCFCFVCMLLVLFMSMVYGRGPHEVTHSTGMTYIFFFLTLSLWGLCASFASAVELWCAALKWAWSLSVSRYSQTGLNKTWERPRLWLIWKKVDYRLKWTCLLSHYRVVRPLVGDHQSSGK